MQSRAADDVCPFWDHRAHTDIAFPVSAAVAALPAPSPLLEWARSGLVRSLRQVYAQECARWMRRAPPKESFNRWVYLQLGVPASVYTSASRAQDAAAAPFERALGVVRDSGSGAAAAVLTTGDPLLPCPAAAARSAVLTTELLAEMPVRCQLTDFAALAADKPWKVRRMHDSVLSATRAWCCEFLRIGGDADWRALGAHSDALALVADDETSFVSGVSAVDALVERAHGAAVAVLRQAMIDAAAECTVPLALVCRALAALASPSASMPNASAAATGSVPSSGSSTWRNRSRGGGGSGRHTASSSNASDLELASSLARIVAATRPLIDTLFRPRAERVCAALATHCERQLAQLRLATPALTAAFVSDEFSIVLDEGDSSSLPSPHATLPHEHTAKRSKIDAHAAALPPSVSATPRLLLIARRAASVRALLRATPALAHWLGVDMSGVDDEAHAAAAGGDASSHANSNANEQSASPPVLLDAVALSRVHLRKLESLYAHASSGLHSPPLPFAVAAFCMLRRYQTLIDSSGAEHSSSSSTSSLSLARFLDARTLPHMRWTALSPTHTATSTLSASSPTSSSLSTVGANAFSLLSAGDDGNDSDTDEVDAGGSASPAASTVGTAVAAAACARATVHTPAAALRAIHFVDVPDQEGAGFHAAAPESLFRALGTELHVRAEVFASPLNAFLPRFCSAFPDTDRYFGSRGSFFDLVGGTTASSDNATGGGNAAAASDSAAIGSDTLSGSFECNPPFVDEVMYACALQIDALLRAAGDAPLSFTVIVPHWTDPPTQFIPHMRASPFARHTFIVPAGAHRYISGAQHNVDTSSAAASSSSSHHQHGRHASAASARYFAAAHETIVFVLQNDAGARAWPTSAAVCARLCKAFE